MLQVVLPAKPLYFQWLAVIGMVHFSRAAANPAGLLRYLASFEIHMSIAPSVGLYPVGLGQWMKQPPLPHLQRVARITVSTTLTALALMTQNAKCFWSLASRPQNDASHVNVILYANNYHAVNNFRTPAPRGTIYLGVSI